MSGRPSHACHTLFNMLLRRSDAIIPTDNEKSAHLPTFANAQWRKAKLQLSNSACTLSAISAVNYDCYRLLFTIEFLCHHCFCHASDNSARFSATHHAVSARNLYGSLCASVILAVLKNNVFLLQATLTSCPGSSTVSQSSGVIALLLFCLLMIARYRKFRNWSEFAIQFPIPLALCVQPLLPGYEYANGVSVSFCLFHVHCLLRLYCLRAFDSMCSLACSAFPR